MRKLEPDLSVATIQIEFRNLVLLQELDQFLQILHVLWFHSFLKCLARGEKRWFKVRSEPWVRG